MQLDQLNDIIASIDPVKYGKTRNFLNGDVSRLSPYVSRGVISTRQIAKTVLKNGYNRFKHEKWLQQLAWREYFQRVLQEKTSLSTIAIKREQNEDGQVLHDGFPTAVMEFATGIQAIDNALSDLYKTGYMHNHARMYTASVVTNIAGARWQEGARWMYYHLLDADVASNACSWQWICSSFSGKKYIANQENINKYSGNVQRGTFLDVSYEELPYIKVPEHLQTFSSLSLETKLPASDQFDLDPNLPTLIYNFYNLDPQWHADEKMNRVLLLEPSHFDTYPVSENVIKFILTLKDNIPDIKVFTGEFTELKNKFKGNYICKEHPLFHYPGAKVENRDWLFPELTGYYPSFFAYWKKAEKIISHY